MYNINTTYIWPYHIKFDYFMTERVVYLEHYVSYNMIPNLLPNRKDWNHFMILEVVSNLT